MTAASMLSALFVGALLYATLILPQRLHRILLRWIPDYGLNWIEAEATIEALRPLGYLCFIIFLLLILSGFLLNRFRLSAFGSLGLYLPAFGHFASTMFFLAGLGVLRVVWLPLMELVSAPWSHRPYDVERLLDAADGVYLPYIPLRVLLCLPSTLSGGVPPLRLIDRLAFYVFVLLGCGILFLGSQTWLYGKILNLELIDLWMYRYSRHPQYLGLLIWSYGLLIYDRFVFIPIRGGYYPAPSLLWLLTALTIIASALKEETEMEERLGERYTEYQASTPFMLPLPRWISNWITLPSRILIGKERPETGREIILILAFYTALIGGVSALIHLPP